jgi:small subunit ribosomal protein S2
MDAKFAQSLFDADVHIGHATSQWNPKMKHFIHSNQNGVHVFDLEKTGEALAKVEKFLKATKIKNGKVLFVGTKPQTEFVLKDVLGDDSNIFTSTPNGRRDF